MIIMMMMMVITGVPKLLTCSKSLNYGGTREVRSNVSMYYRRTMQPLHSMFGLTAPTQTNDGKCQIDYDTGAYVPYSFHQTSSESLN